MGMRKQIFVISLGGSIIVPGGAVDTAFLKSLRAFIARQVKKGRRFVIITGGGSVCRMYQQAAREIAKPSDEDLDWIGLQTTRLNAHLVRSILGSTASDKVYFASTMPRSAKKPVTIVCGEKPGSSTDLGAVKIAKRINANMVINLSNIDYVYDKDPGKYKTAKRIEEISWKDFRKIVGNEWDPGLSMPFDPIASRMAQKMHLPVAIANGKDLKNLGRILDGTSFKGTLIS